MDLGASRILADGGVNSDEQMPDELPDVLFEPQVSRRRATCFRSALLPSACCSLFAACTRAPPLAVVGLVLHPWQVIVLVTKLPYHESFTAILRHFVQHHLPAMVTERGVTHDHLAELYSSVAQPTKLELPSSWRLQRYMPDSAQAESTSLWVTQRDKAVPDAPRAGGASPQAGGSPRRSPAQPPRDQKDQKDADAALSGEDLATSMSASMSVRRASVLERQKPVLYFEQASVGPGSSAGSGPRKGTGKSSGPSAVRARRVLQPPPGAVRWVTVAGRELSVPSMNAAQWEDEFSARCTEADNAPLYSALQPSNIVRLFSAALLEQSVLVLAADPKHLFDCLETLRAMLFPLTWYHIYLPALPNLAFMMGQLQAPVTYLAGACKSFEGVMENIKLENCVVADLDDDVVLDALDYLRHRHEAHDAAVASQAATAVLARGSALLGGSAHGGGPLAEACLAMDFDEVNDWRMDQFYSYNDRHPRSTLAAPLPPRYALKLHREIRRCAPLWERGAGSRRRNRPGGGEGSVAFLPIDLPPDASDSLKLLAAREAAGGGAGGGGGGGGDGGPRSSVGLWSASEGKGGASRANAGVGGRLSSMSGRAGATGAGHASGRSRSKTAALVTLSVLNVIEGSSSEEELGDEADGGGSDDGDEGTTWVVTGADGVAPGTTDLDGGGGGSLNSFTMTMDMQLKNLFALRRVFFAVLTSLLKGYREHIKSEERRKRDGRSLSADGAGGSRGAPQGPGPADGGRVEGGGHGDRSMSPLQQLSLSIKGDAPVPDMFFESSLRPGELGMALQSKSSATVSDDYELSEVFDAAGFVGAREKGLGDELHLKAFLDIFLAQPIFLNYMHARTAAVTEDALDRAIYKSRCRRAFRLDQVADVKLVVSLGQAFKARMDSHSHSLWGPTSWKRRVFELRHLEQSATSSGSPAELLCLTYFEVDSELEQLDLLIRELKVREKSTRDATDLVARRKRLEVERADRRAKAKRGEMILRKGATTFHIPDRGGRGSIVTLKG